MRLEMPVVAGSSSSAPGKEDAVPSMRIKTKGAELRPMMRDCETPAGRAQSSATYKTWVRSAVSDDLPPAIGKPRPPSSFGPADHTTTQKRLQAHLLHGTAAEMILPRRLGGQ